MWRRVFWYAVAVSIGFWLAELSRYYSQHAPVRYHPTLEGAAPMTSHLRRKSDAANRGLRTFLQGLAFAVLAAVAMVLYPVFTSAHGWGDLHWSLLSFALVQAVGMAVLSYLMRTVLDPSRIRTPLPPADPGEPDARPVPEAG